MIPKSMLIMSLLFTAFSQDDKYETQNKQKLVARVTLRDKSTFTGMLKAEAITIKNVLGTLKILAKDVFSIEFGDMEKEEKDRITFSEGMLQGLVQEESIVLETEYGTLKIPTKKIESVSIEYNSGTGRLIISEDWEKIEEFPTGAWGVVVQQSANPHIASFGSGDSKKSLDGSGNGHNEISGVYYKKTIDASNGLEMQMDFWNTGGGGHYTDSCMGLRNEEGFSFNSPILHVQANRGGGHVLAIDLFDSNKQCDGFRGKYTPEQWNTVKVKIRTDRKVELYLNDKKLWTSKKTVDHDSLKKCYFYLWGQSAGGPAYMDNIRVMTSR